MAHPRADAISGDDLSTRGLSTGPTTDGMEARGPTEVSTLGEPSPSAQMRERAGVAGRCARRQAPEPDDSTDGRVHA